MTPEPEAGAAPTGEHGDVLIVDDQQHVAQVLRAMTESLGHRCAVASGVEEALAVFASRSFDVVISDVKMGTLGGFDLLQRLHERAPNVPVILITGDATVNAAMQAIEAHAYDYLSKPVALDRLRGLLGLTFLFQGIPALAMGLIGGSLADLFDRRRLLQVVVTLEAILVTALALLTIAFDDPAGYGRHCGGCSDSDPYDPAGGGRHCGRACSDSSFL